jgi:lipopolysaccharide biosynthesis regulator YciM
LDLLLLGSFAWSELIGPGLRSALWAAFGVGWVIAAGWSARECRRWMAAGTLDPLKDPFVEALDYYLKGDYYQAERLLEGVLRKNLRDVDARLMLATLLRHTGRPNEAMQQLNMLTRYEGAGKWQWEIQQERQLLANNKAVKAA